MAPLSEICVNEAEIRVRESDRDIIRGVMIRALREWDGATQLAASAKLTRAKRLLIRAYAEVYGVDLEDENDKPPGSPLTAAELAHLPELCSEIRTMHPDAPKPRTAITVTARPARRRAARVVGRVGQELAGGGSKLGELIGQAIWWVASEVVRAVWLFMYPFVGAVELTVRFAPALPIAYLCFGIKFGFATPFHYAAAMWRWLATHPAQDWIAFKDASVVLLIWAVIVGLITVFGERPPKPYVPAPPVPLKPHIVGDYGPHAIEGFHEQSAFGDASLAEKQKIARALQGLNSNQRPLFED